MLHIANRIFGFLRSFLAAVLAFLKQSPRSVPRNELRILIFDSKVIDDFCRIFVSEKNWWKCDWKLSRLCSGISSNCCNWKPLRHPVK
jgi:hypothetical protein